MTPVKLDVVETATDWRVANPDVARVVVPIPALEVNDVPEMAWAVIAP